LLISQNFTSTESLLSLQVLNRQLQVCHNMLQVGGLITPNSLSGTVPARDEIPIIFVAKFSVVPMPAVFDTSCTCKLKMAEVVSYKCVSGRDIVMLAATTHFSGMPDPLPPVPTSSDFREQHQVQTGSRNSSPNWKYS